MEEEIWKDIIEYEGYYQVSNLGRVRSTGKSRNISKWRVLKTKTYSNKRYINVSLTKNSITKYVSLHRLVAEYFVDNNSNMDLKNLVVNHKDKNPSNNHYTNLEWCTQRENVSYSKDKINNYSKYTGVSWCLRSNKWKAYNSINKKRLHLGTFNSEEEAYKAKLKNLSDNNIINKYN